MNKFEELKKIVASKTSSSEKDITIDTSMQNLNKWDSMAHLQITVCKWWRTRRIERRR